MIQTQFGVLDHFHLLDGLFRQHCRRAADRAEIEAAVFLAGIGDLLAAISLRDHDHAAAFGLEEIDVAVHAARGR